MHMQVYVFVCMCTCIYSFIDIHIHVCVHVCMYVNLHNICTYIIFMRIHITELLGPFRDRDHASKVLYATLVVALKGCDLDLAVY